MIRSLLYRLLESLLVLFLIGATLWASAALYFDAGRHGAILAAVYCVLVGLCLFWINGKRKRFIFLFLGFGAVLSWWFTLKPSNEGNWQPDVSQLAWAQVDGDRVTLHHVRDCDYRTETDYTPRWITRTVNLSKLTGVDVAFTYWGSPWIAHPIVSFQFSDAAPICFSIETRKQVGQEYSAIKGFFRQYPLIYVVAEERDVIRLRSNYREGEEVYLYRTAATPAEARALFLEYVKALNSLRNHPQWYNAVTANCTTSIRYQRASEERNAWDWRLILNGKADELLYERDDLQTEGLSFLDLKKKAHINPVARRVEDDSDFSIKIREGRPGF